ncbi:MAG: tetratricopeptide repeat protein, partial [Bacteroidales bacterium]|nr:tetratricopeptide repeat protein [Candidatus Liminaster caballi]
LQVAFFIQNGELTRADSLLNTKGSMEERSAEIDRLRSANRKEREDIEKRQANLIQSDSLASKLLEDFAADCYSHYEICKLQHKNDSAAYWLELRASKDTTNGEWQVDCGIFILNYQANYTLAQTYMERALNIVNNNPDFSDDSRGSCFANLADVYLKCGQYNEAINMYTRALCLHSKKSEEYVAATVGLANCYEIISENKKAADCLREAYSVYQQMNYHTPEILLRIYNQLATNLVKRGNFEEAQKFLNLSLELAENDEAIDLPRQIIVYFDAASFYREMNKYEESESLLKKALEVSLVIYEDKHPTISSIYNGLGVLYYNLSNMENAIYYLLKAKDCHTNNRDNEQYAQVCSNIAGIYLREGKLDLSEQYEIEAYNIRVKIFGEDSPAMFNQYNALTALYCEKGEYEKGLGYVEKAIALIKREAGEMHPSLNASYSYVGGINMRLGRLEEALKWFKLALDVSKHYYGNEHTETADAYSNIGGISLYLKRYDEAIDMLKESLRIHIAVYGEKHVDVAADYNGLAQTYMAMGNYQDAISNFEKAIDIRKEVFGNNSVKLKPLYGFMIEIYQKLGDVKKAESYSKLLDAIQE